MEQRHLGNFCAIGESRTSLQEQEILSKPLSHKLTPTRTNRLPLQTWVKRLGICGSFPKEGTLIYYSLYYRNPKAATRRSLNHAGQILT